MRRSFRWVSAMALALGALLALSACGSSSSTSSSSSSSSSGKTGGTANVLFGTAPDSLDPQFGYTTQAAEPDWISYTGLLTYAHASGDAGGQLIPGLAESLPQVSADGLTYTLTLRKGLVFSNGKPVKASDFTYTIERAHEAQLGRQVLLHQLHQGRRRLRRRQGQDDLRDQGRRRDRQDHDHPGQGLRCVRQRDRLPGGGPGAHRDEDVQPAQQPAARVSGPT